MIAISLLFFVLFHLAIHSMVMVMAVLFVLFMIWIRASLARLRFDQLLHLGWAHILPFTIAAVLAIPALLFTLVPLTTNPPPTIRQSLLSWG